MNRVFGSWFLVLGSWLRGHASPLGAQDSRLKTQASSLKTQASSLTRFIRHQWSFISALGSPASLPARDRSKLAKIVTPLAVIAVCWVLGRAIARENYTIALGLFGLSIFYMLFFHKASLLWLAPIAVCVPNMGLDIPGSWAISIEDAFSLAAFAALVSRTIMTKQPFLSRGAPVLLPLIVFWTIAVVSLFKVTLISPENMIYIVKDLLRLTMLVMFYITMVDAVRTKANVLLVIRVLLLLAVPMAIISWYIYLTKSEFFYYILTMKPAYIFYRTKILRMISIMGSTSFTGLYYAVILALAMTYPGWLRGKRFTLPKYAFTGLVLSCLVFTFNRGTWVGVILGLVLILFLGKMTWRKVMVLFTLVSGMIVVASGQFFSRFDVEQRLSAAVEVSRSSGMARLVRWKSSINVILDQPLLGVGYNNYAYVYGRYTIEQGVVPTYGSPHNMYVDLVAGVGIVGLAVFFLFLWRLWKMHLSNLRDSRDPDLRNVSLGLLLVFAFFLGASGFDSFLFKPHHTTYVIFLLWALTTAIWRMNRAEATEN